MKWIALLLTILWLTSCASADRSARPVTVVPIENAPVSPLTRSVELGPTRTVERTATLPLVVTQPIETATSLQIAPTRTPTVRSHPKVTSTSPECPPLPAPTGVETQAAVQHFEHGLMFWLQEHDEIWVLIASPTKDQFYWRVLPNAWSEGQPEVDPKVQSPAGRFQPRRGFGVAWRSGGGSYGPQRPDLGWAVDEEIGFNTTLIYYPQGFYSPDCTWMPKSGIYELADEHGRVYRFVGAGGIAQMITGRE